MGSSDPPTRRRWRRVARRGVRVLVCVLDGRNRHRACTVRHLAEAKASLPHGEWLPWIERELPVTPRTVNRLMGIADHEGLANETHGSHLPSSWRTLSELAQLDVPQLDGVAEMVLSVVGGWVCHENYAHSTR